MKTAVLFDWFINQKISPWQIFIDITQIIQSTQHQLIHF